MKTELTPLIEIVKKLHKLNTFAIFCHAHPDGDALGSGLALALALKNAGKNAYFLCEDELPENLCINNAVDSVLKTFPFKKENFDAFISVDCADVSRMGVFAKAFTEFKGLTVNIDHHISNTFFAKYNYVFDCTATCELMPEILEAAGFEISGDIADLLAMGLLTDSGNFAHKDVSEKTFTVAAKLKARGANISGLNYNLFTKQSKKRALLYGRIIGKIRFALDDKLGFITVTQKDFEETGTDKKDTEGFVDFPLSIDGVEVAASLMEVKSGQYKVSLRSKNVNVNAVASVFGGGGHILASGCMLFGEYEEVVEKLVFTVSRYL